MNRNLGRDTPHHIRLLVDHLPSMLAYRGRDLRCRFANGPASAGSASTPAVSSARR
jgi:hypothetical protein